MRLLLTTWVTGLLAVLPLPARSEEPFGSGLHAARVHVERQQYEQALNRLKDLRQPSLSAEQKLTLTLYEGLILARMGPRRQREALTALRSALFQDPQVRLPLKAPSQVTRDFEELRVQVLAEKRAIAKAFEFGALPPGVVMPGFSITSTHVLIPTLAGGGLVASGGALWTLARREQARLENADPEETSDEDLRRMASRGKTYQTLSFSMLGAGAVSLGIATMLHMRRKSQSPVALGMGLNGTSVVAYGSWL